MLLFPILSLLSLTALLGAAEHSNLHHDAVHPEAYGYPAAQTVFAQNEAKRVAIVGAGASGAAAAFFLRRAARVAEQRAGLMEGELLGDVVVYEFEDWIGGRSITVHPHSDKKIRPVELGASIFVQANQNLVKVADLLNLTVIDPDFGGSGFGVWDGQEFLFQTTGESYWWDTFAALRRYGPLSFYRQRKAVAGLLKRFANLYSAAWLSQRGPISSIEDFAKAVDLGNDMTTVTGAEWAANVVKVGARWATEIMEGSTRVNYASDMDEIHALGAAVSLAASGSRAIKGGNWNIFAGMLKDARADVQLGTEVTNIALQGDRFKVSAGMANNSELFDQVFFAAPWGSTPMDKKIEEAFSAPIPDQKYIKLHVTLLTTAQKTPNPAFFQQPPGTKIPTAIITTSIAAKVDDSPLPPFQSLTYHGETFPNSGEWVVKIFSLAPMDDDTLYDILGGYPTWVLRKTWESYPALRPIAAYAPVEPVPGFHYLASLEPWVSTMETQTISAREAVARVAQKWWGLGLGECADGDSWEMSCD